MLQRLLLLLLELLYNVYNEPTFILALAMPGTNARSKPGGNSEPWIYQGEVEAKVARTTQTLSQVNDGTKGSRIKRFHSKRKRCSRIERSTYVG